MAKKFIIVVFCIMFLVGCKAKEEEDPVEINPPIANIQEPISVEKEEVNRNTDLSNWSIYTDWIRYSTEFVSTEYDADITRNVNYDCSQYMKDDLFIFHDFLTSLEFTKNNEGAYVYDSQSYKLTVVPDILLIILDDYDSTLWAKIQIVPYCRTGDYPVDEMTAQLYGPDATKCCVTPTDNITQWPTKQLENVCSIIDAIRYSPTALLNAAPTAYNIMIGENNINDMGYHGGTELYIEDNVVILRHPAWIPHRQ